MRKNKDLPDAADVKAAAEIVEVAQWLGLAPRPRGRVWVARCLYPDRHRRGDRKAEHLVLDPERGTYRCYACGYWGDVISLVQEVMGVGFREALELLAERYGVATSRGGGGTTQQRRSAMQKPTERRPRTNAPGGSGDLGDARGGKAGGEIEGPAPSRRSATTSLSRGVVDNWPCQAGDTSAPARQVEEELGASAGEGGAEDEQADARGRAAVGAVRPAGAGDGESEGAFGVRLARQASGERGVAEGSEAEAPCGRLGAAGPAEAVADGSADVYEFILERCPLSRRALEYLERRGLSAEMCLAARLGWVESPERLEKELRRRFGVAALQRAGVLTESGYFIFSRHPLVWPVFWPKPARPCGGAGDGGEEKGRLGMGKAGEHIRGRAWSAADTAGRGGELAVVGRRGTGRGDDVAAWQRGNVARPGLPSAPALPSAAGWLTAADARGDWERAEVVPVYLIAEAVNPRVRSAGPKRLNLARPVPCPYMAHLLAWGEVGEVVIVCEGPVDTLLAVQAGYMAIGLPGAGSFRPEWARWLLPYDVYLALDADAAGRRGAHRIARELWKLGKRARVLPLPDGMDLGDYLTGGLHGRSSGG